MRKDAKVKHAKLCEKLAIQFANEGQLDKVKACEKALKDEIPDAPELKVIADKLAAVQADRDNKKKAEQEKLDKEAKEQAAKEEKERVIQRTIRPS